MRLLREQIILVTGATSGLGRHLARELAAAGTAVIIHGRDEAKVDQVRAEMAATSSPATASVEERSSWWVASSNALG